MSVTTATLTEDAGASVVVVEESDEPPQPAARAASPIARTVVPINARAVDISPSFRFSRPSSSAFEQPVSRVDQRRIGQRRRAIEPLPDRRAQLLGERGVPLLDLPEIALEKS